MYSFKVRKLRNGRNTFKQLRILKILQPQPPAIYATLSQPAEGIYKDRGSKFMGFAFPVETESAVRDALLQLKKQHHGARHFCYAYRINPKNIYERANDDGEPNHSAGTPILGQLLSRNLVNVLVVVVRYFGGTKLGVPGLIKAYKTSAAEALNTAQIIEKNIESTVAVTFDYTEMNDVMRLVKTLDCKIENQVLSLRVNLVLRFREDLENELISALSLIKNLTFEP